MNEVERGPAAFFLLISLGAASGLLSMWIFQRLANHAKLRQAANRVLAHLLEFHLFSAEPVLLLKAQRELLSSNLRVLRLIAVPSLVLVVPFLLCLAIVDACFTHAPLQTGQAAVVTAQFGGDFPSLPRAALRTPPGIEVDAGPVHVPQDRQISWRIRVLGHSAGTLELASPRDSVQKSISARPGPQWLSESRQRFPGFLLHPTEPPLFGSAFASISVSYPTSTVLHRSPLLWFVIGSLGGALLYFPLVNLSLPASRYRRN